MTRLVTIEQLLEKPICMMSGQEFVLLLQNAEKQTAKVPAEVVPEKHYEPEFGISDSRFSCYVGFPTDAYYIYPPNNMDGKMQNCKVQIKFTL